MPVTHQPLRSRLNDVAFENIRLMSLALLTSQALMSALNDVAFENIRLIPRPATSTSEAPPVRPAGDAPPSVLPAHPRISAAHYHTLSSRRSLAPASPPASSAPLLCLVTSCPTPPRFQPRKAL